MINCRTQTDVLQMFYEWKISRYMSVGSEKQYNWGAEFDMGVVLVI
jgi:hypothetical protein